MTPALDTVIGYVPGLIGRVVEMHARYYGEHWGFGDYFEAKVASELAHFIIRYDPQRDRIWSVVRDGRIEGSITIGGTLDDDNEAHLRWFIVSDGLQGQGVGNALMAEAMVFCREVGFDRVYLSTFEGLHAARHLYEKYGFTLVEARRGDQWGTVVMEQRLEATAPFAVR